jgi:hypothetical protein
MYTAYKNYVYSSAEGEDRARQDSGRSQESGARPRCVMNDLNYFYFLIVIFRICVMGAKLVVRAMHSGEASCLILFCGCAQAQTLVVSVCLWRHCASSSVLQCGRAGNTISKGRVDDVTVESDLGTFACCMP